MNTTVTGEYYHHHDVFVLDCERLKWAAVATSGPTPSPRSQHSAVVVGNEV